MKTFHEERSGICMEVFRGFSELQLCISHITFPVFMDESRMSYVCCHS